jgi:predicted amidohydrolase YtcJ
MLSVRPEARWLLRNVEVGGHRLDCRIDRGEITELSRDLPERDGENVLDARGGALLPGLADHHIHVMAAAAAAQSVDLQGNDLTGVDQGDDRRGTRWLRVIGAGTALQRADVDRAWPDRPVRVQHRSGALWTLNSPAIAEVAHGLSDEERSTGQLWRADQRLRALLPDSDSLQLDIIEVGRRLAAYGVTHLTDATPDVDPGVPGLLRSAMPQHLLFMGDQAGPGPCKRMIVDHEAPDLDLVAAAVARDHAGGRPVALHAVSSAAVAMAIAAFGIAGTVPGDRIEHAAVCSDAAAERIAALGIVVVTQPSIPIRNGIGYRDESEPDEIPLLWRYAGLLRAGVQVAMSSDAPYGSANPWFSIQCATQRRLSDGSILGDAERVPAEVALASLTTSPIDPAGPSRTVVVGAAADLCVLTVPLPEALSAASASGISQVRATFVQGQCIHRSESPARRV